MEEGGRVTKGEEGKGNKRGTGGRVTKVEEGGRVTKGEQGEK